MSRALRRVLVVGILLAAGLVFAKLRVESEAAPPGAMQHEPAMQRPVTAVTAESALPTAQRDAALPVLEREAAPPPLADTGRTSTSGRLVGRCVAAEDDAPLQGCVIEVVARGQERGTTDADGCFAIDFVPMPSGSITVKTQASGRVPLEGQILVEGSVRDLGTIRVPRGFVVSGRVVDLDGNGVPGHTVNVTDVDTALRPERVSKSTVSAACADDGSFTLGIPLPAGAWHAKLQGPRRQRGDGAFHVQALTGVEPLTLVVEPPNDITGVVVDTTGRALSNVGLYTEHGGATASSSRGAFELIAQQPVSGSTRILLRDPEAWSQAFVPPTVAWGQRDVRIVIPSAANVTVEVVDDSGAPVTPFRVLLQPEVGGGSSTIDCTHPDGRIDIACSRRGRHVLFIAPQARNLRASERVLEVGSAPLPVQRVVLERLHEVAVQVVAADQAGIEDARVELLVPRDNPQLASQVLGGVQVSSGVTDARGLCSLYAPANCRGHLLRVSRQGFLPASVFDPPLSPGSAFRVVLASGGALRGSVELHDESPKQFRVSVTPADGRAADDESRRFVTLESDLTFALPALAPGEYRVQVLRGHHAMIGNVPGAPAQRVTILAGQTTEVRFEVRPVVEGSLAGRLVTSDATNGRRVQLVFADAENAVCGTFAVADDGAFLAEELLPGRYHLAVHSPSMPAVLAAVVEIAPGVVHHHDFTFTSRKLTLRLRTPAGEPATGNFELRCGPLVRQTQLPKTNELVLDPAPELPVQVRWLGGTEWSEAIAMPGNRTEHAADVVVRPRR